MVKRLLKFFAYLLFFVVALMFFMPKVSLYHFAETQIKPFGVIFSNERVEDSGFTLKIEDTSVSMKKIPSAEIEMIEMKIWGVYNTIDIKNIVLSKAVKSFAPINIDKINVSYTILNPLNITAYAEGGFGVAKATVDIVERKLHVDMEPSKIMKKKYRQTLRNLKKTKGGGYTYDENF